jgi:predicted membrane-bound mannosyltransferase
MTAIHGHLDASRYTRLAWWSLLGFVPSFVLAFVVGEGIISALGYPSGGEEQPAWSDMVLAVVPALMVFALPAVLVVHFGRRAVGLGDPQGRVPMILAAVAAGGFVLVNGLSGLLVWLS